MLSGLVTKPILLINKSKSNAFVDGESEAFQKIKSRFFQLIIPFCVWGIITTNFGNHVPYYRIFILPDLSLWFLWVLFLINVTFYVGQSIAIRLHVKSNLFTIVATYIALYLVSYLSKGIFGIGMASNFFLYFAIGVIMGQHKSYISNFRCGIIISIVLVIAYVILASVWYRFPGKVPTHLPLWIATLNDSYIYHTATALVASFAFILVASRLSTKNPYRPLVYLGTNTLGIYAIHQSIIKLLNYVFPDIIFQFMHTIPGFFCSFSIVITLTIILLETFKLNKYTSLLFVGTN